MKTARQLARDAKELWRFCLVDGSVDQNRARRVADNLADSPRPGALAIGRAFLRLVKLDAARRSARIESASPLASDLRAAVESGLARRYGQQTTATFVVDPSLIGGMRVTIGSNVYDGSVRGELTALEARF